MTDLMVSSDAKVVFGDNTALLFGAVKHALYSLINLGIGDSRMEIAYSKDCRFIENVFKIRACAAGGELCDFIKIDIIRKMLLARVNIKNLPASLDVGIVDGNPAVEPAGTQKR